MGKSYGARLIVRRSHTKHVVYKKCHCLVKLQLKQCLVVMCVTILKRYNLECFKIKVTV